MSSGLLLLRFNTLERVDRAACVQSHNHDGYIAILFLVVGIEYFSAVVDMPAKMPYAETILVLG